MKTRCNVNGTRIQEASSSRLAFISLFIAFLIGIPTSARSAPTLNLVSSYVYEQMSQTGPENIIDTIWNGLFGVDLIGPGGMGMEFQDDGLYVSGTASGFQNVSWQFWNYGSTQHAYSKYLWTAVYRLDGDIGDSGDIGIDYSYGNIHYNFAADGRSQSQSYAGLSYVIIPSEEASAYGQDAYAAYMNRSPSSSLNEPEASDYVDHTFVYDRNYYVAAATWGDDTETDSFFAGNMETGDLLYTFGHLTVVTEAQVYGPGVVISTMVSTLDVDFVVTDTTPCSVPEPATMLLLGSGLVGLVGFSKKLRL